MASSNRSPSELAYRTLLKREESYAIHALVYAAENPGAASAQIAADLQMPPAFLAKVLRRLSEVGYVANRQGRNGGVTLIVDPTQLTLLDVIEAMSGPLVLDTCQTKTRCATQQRKGYCRLNVCWVNATLAIQEVLRGVRLAQLMDRPRAPHALDASAHPDEASPHAEEAGARTHGASARTEPASAPEIGTPEGY